jgi:hypothetical protein
MHTFEYDLNKSQINLDKHGIDFEEAKLLWNDSDLVEIPANTSDGYVLDLIFKHKLFLTHQCKSIRYRQHT